MRIRVPPDQSDPFRDLLAMDPAKRRDLLAAVRQSPPSLTLRQLARQVSRSLEVELTDVLLPLIVLGSLFRTRVSVGADVNAFAGAVCEAGKTLMQAENDSRPVDWDRSREDLAEAFRMDTPLGVTAKAVDVAAAHTRVFAEARVLTDVRAIFQEDPSRKPGAAVMLHNLEITFYQDGSSKKLFFALDSADVRNLQKALDRALTKEGTLKTWLSACNVEWLSEEDAEDGLDTD